MSKQAAEHHHRAAEHHEHAARHHKEAAMHHEAGRHETAAHHAHLPTLTTNTRRTTLQRQPRRIWSTTAKPARPTPSLFKAGWRPLRLTYFPPFIGKTR
jgi:hypothetical protein